MKHPFTDPMPERLKSPTGIYGSGKMMRSRRWVLFLFMVIAVCLFLPWTQHIEATGNVTALRQENRPQEVNAIIPGRIIKWHIKEGDRVKAGDTLVELAEIKDEYLDSTLLTRTMDQVDAKLRTIDFYKSKADATVNQINALRQSLRLKLLEIENKIIQQKSKIQSDSIEWMAASNDYRIKQKQYQRQLNLYDSGLVSLTQLEQRNQSFQDAIAKRNNTEIKFTNARQELLRLQIEKNSVQQEYAEKMAKNEGDRFQILSQIANGEGEVAKLENQYMNYRIRRGLYFILAPQSGQVTRAGKSGIGELVKEGEKLCEIIPGYFHHAVEMYVRPIDLPLLHEGQAVRFRFDGFPAIVFSGWPEASFGIFGGKVMAIENAAGQDGKFRVLVAEDTTYRPWPALIRMGTGAVGIALLKDVPVWYELWRNINGFPPDFYTKTESDNKK